MIKNWETKVWMWEIKKIVDLCGHKETRQKDCAVRSVREHEFSSCMASNGPHSLRTSDVFGIGELHLGKMVI